MGELLKIQTEAVELLAQILNDSKLTEIEYRQGEVLIRVVKNSPQVTTNAVIASPPHSPPPDVLSEDLPVATTGTPLFSPLVGTAYRSPEPTADPFVKEGDVVEEGQILMLLEAMKVMNPIRSPRAGTIQKIHAQNASPVEFGEILLTYVD